MSRRSAELSSTYRNGTTAGCHRGADHGLEHGAGSPQPALVSWVKVWVGPRYAKKMSGMPRCMADATPPNPQIGAVRGVESTLPLCIPCRWSAFESTAAVWVGPNLTLARTHLRRLNTRLRRQDLDRHVRPAGQPIAAVSAATAIAVHRSQQPADRARAPPGAATVRAAAQDDQAARQHPAPVPIDL